MSLESGADIARIGELDQKLWVALACPTTGLEFDEKTLFLIDTDNDGRIRASELIAAVNWTCNLLKRPSDLIKGSPALSLEAVNDSTPEGAQLLASAKQLLINLGKTSASAVTLEDTADQTKIFAATNFNGDGIVPADAADDGGHQKLGPARLMTMVLAVGTSMPVSMMVEHSSTLCLPPTNSRITRSSSRSGIWPWATTMRASGSSASSFMRRFSMVSTSLCKK